MLLARADSRGKTYRHALREWIPLSRCRDERALDVVPAFLLGTRQPGLGERSKHYEFFFSFFIKIAASPIFTVFSSTTRKRGGREKGRKRVREVGKVAVRGRIYKTVVNPEQSSPVYRARIVANETTFPFLFFSISFSHG